MGLFKHYGSTQAKTKGRRVLNFGIPKLGQIALSRDPGDASSLFSQHFLRTNLRMRKFDSYGQVVLDENVGAGLVTNVGVYALASDYQYQVEATAKLPFNIFNMLLWQGWGTTNTPAAATDIKLTAAAAPNTVNCVKVTTAEFKVEGAGKPKYVTKGKIKAESSISVVEWGLFSAEKIAGIAHGTAEKAASVTENSLTIAAANEFSDGSTDILKGERGTIAFATETNESWLYIKKNSKTVLEGLPTHGGTPTPTNSSTKAWFKQSTGAFAQPGATTPFKVIPVMWDHKIFTGVGVETGNEIEFIYELEFPSGG